MLSNALDCGKTNDQLAQLQAIDALRDGNHRILATLGVGASGGAGSPPVQFVVGQ